MNPLIQALHKIIKFLESEEVDYMIIGGIANSIYGNPKQTFDIDIKVKLEKIEVFKSRSLILEQR